MTPLEQKIIDEYKKEFVIKSNAGTGLLRYTDADKLENFILTSLQQVREETIKEIINQVDNMVFDELDNGTYKNVHKILDYITNKEVNNLKKE